MDTFTEDIRSNAGELTTLRAEVLYLRRQIEKLVEENVELLKKVAALQLHAKPQPK